MATDIDREYPLLNDVIFVMGRTCLIIDISKKDEGRCDICGDYIREGEDCLELPLLHCEDGRPNNVYVWFHISCFEKLAQRVHDAIQEHTTLKLDEKGM